MHVLVCVSDRSFSSGVIVPFFPQSHHNSNYHHVRGTGSQFGTTKAPKQNDFYDILYSRLVVVQKNREKLKIRARNIAREAGKTFNEIMVSESLNTAIQEPLVTVILL